jgi:hypothetical protein
MDNICAICLEKSCDIIDRTQFCTSITQESLISCCVECMNEYLNRRLLSGYKGYCPIMYCPLCSASTTKESKCIMKYSFLKTSSVFDSIQYFEFAKSLLSIQCASCHLRKTLIMEYTDEQINSAKQILLNCSETLTSASHLDTLLNKIKDFEHGLIGISKFYELLLLSFFPDIEISDNESRKIMDAVLSLIDNPERRANLQLRYIRSFPKVVTPCCKREQCFRCKTKEFHSGKTCEENVSQLDNSILLCMQCNVHLVKGDGCDNMWCICGRNFSWSTEITTQQRSIQFSTKFPYNTELQCANVLCGTVEGERNLAEAWGRLHAVDLNRGYLQWWYNQHPFCPTQCSIQPLKKICSIYPERFAANISRACKLWRETHDLSHAIAQQNLVFSSAMKTFYPSEIDIYYLKQRNTSKVMLSNEPLLRACSSLVLEHLSQKVGDMAKDKDPSNGVEQFFIERIQQFLCIFGHFQIYFSYSSLDSLAEVECAENINVMDTLKQLLTLKVGDKIRCQWGKKKKYYSAIILNSNNDGYYDVEFFDGVQEFRVCRTKIKKLVDAVQPKKNLFSYMGPQQLETFNDFLVGIRELSLNKIGDYTMYSIMQCIEQASTHWISKFHNDIDLAREISETLQHKVILPLSSKANNKISFQLVKEYELTWNDIFSSTICWNKFCFEKDTKKKLA